MKNLFVKLKKMTLASAAEIEAKNSQPATHKKNYKLKSMRLKITAGPSFYGLDFDRIDLDFSKK